MTDTSPLNRVWDLIEAIPTAFLVTSEGSHGRPMSTIAKRDEGLIYYLTDRLAVKDEEIEADPNVLLTMSNGGNKFTVITGTAAIVENRALVARLWNPGAQAFWPQGPDDPRIAAIVVTPSAAEYWAGPGGLVAGIKLAFAIATRQTPDFGENKKVRMTS